MTSTDSSLTRTQESAISIVLKFNVDLFAWTATDMLGIHPSIMSHKLVLFKEERLVAQKKRRLGEEKDAR